MSHSAEHRNEHAGLHLAGGELHVWLDGALDQLGERRAAEVREHLRACAACRDALADEERMRARASEVLALAEPRGAEPPPFELLVERARGAATAAPARRVSRAARLGWAASVMVALGAGWVARELGLHPRTAQEAAPAPLAGPGDSRPPGGGFPAAEAADVPAVGAAGSAGPRAPSANEALGGGADARGRAPGADGTGLVREGGASATAPVVSPTTPEASPAPAPVAPLATAGVGADLPTAPEAARAAPAAASGSTATVEAAPSSAPAADPPLRLDQVIVIAQAEKRAAEERVAEEEPAEALSATADEPLGFAGAAARAEVRREGARAQRALASRAAPAPTGVGIQQPGGDPAGPEVPELFTGPAEVAARAGAPEGAADLDEALDLTVPGLEVLRVEWAEVAPGQRGLRVLQRLSGGDTLEVRFVRSAVGDTTVDPLTGLVSAPLRAGWSQVVRVHRDGWLIARAPLARDVLEALVERAGTR